MKKLINTYIWVRSISRYILVSLVTKMADNEKEDLFFCSISLMITGRIAWGPQGGLGGGRGAGDAGEAEECHSSNLQNCLSFSLKQTVMATILYHPHHHPPPSP